MVDPGVDGVSIDGFTRCGECHECRIGYDNLCSNMSELRSAGLFRPGRPVGLCRFLSTASRKPSSRSTLVLVASRGRRGQLRPGAPGFVGALPPGFAGSFWTRRLRGWKPGPSRRVLALNGYLAATHARPAAGASVLLPFLPGGAGGSIPPSPPAPATGRRPPRSRTPFLDLQPGRQSLPRPVRPRDRGAA